MTLRNILIFVLFCPFILLKNTYIYSFEASQEKIHTIFTTIPADSLSKNIAFYQLYPNTPEGQITLKRIYKLLSSADITTERLKEFDPSATTAIIDIVISLVSHTNLNSNIRLSDSDLEVIENLAKCLKNRNLKGHKATTEEEVLALSSEEIDLSRGLMLSQFNELHKDWNSIRTYEAMLDLMALHIRSKLPQNPSIEQIIETINYYLFHELRFQFPPHSQYAKDIDIYTFLPQVLDAREGVCLGVSLVYMCIAQRLGIDLELVTPPGHIYVRYRDKDRVINIETTARGIHLDTEAYQGINTAELPIRNIKEAIGFSHFNHAASSWIVMDPQAALKAYNKAIKYLHDDALLLELQGYALILCGNEDKGKENLLKALSLPHKMLLVRDPTIDDILTENCDADALRAILQHVDEKRSSLVQKVKQIEISLQRFPKFRSGLLHLATTYLQLHDQKKGLFYLEKFHEIDPSNLTVEYFLSALYLERSHYSKAWEHLISAEKIATNYKHQPKDLKQLRKVLSEKLPKISTK
ncbi:MAG: SirB1 family protein [Chlamydiales bacterium]